jgi:hypothetical protein
MDINTLILALLVPAISGLAFLAYKHPLGFGKIAKVLAIAISLIIFGILSYYYGKIIADINILHKNLTTTNEVRYYLDNINSLYESKSAINTSLLIFLATMFYIMILYTLPLIVGIKTENSIKEKHKNGGS